LRNIHPKGFKSGPSTYVIQVLRSGYRYSFRACVSSEERELDSEIESSSQATFRGGCDQVPSRENWSGDSQEQGAISFQVHGFKQEAANRG